MTVSFRKHRITCFTGIQTRSQASSCFKENREKTPREAHVSWRVIKWMFTVNTNISHNRSLSGIFMFLGGINRGPRHVHVSQDSLHKQVVNAFLPHPKAGGSNREFMKQQIAGALPLPAKRLLLPLLSAAISLAPIEKISS